MQSTNSTQNYTNKFNIQKTVCSIAHETFQKCLPMADEHKSFQVSAHAAYVWRTISIQHNQKFAPGGGVYARKLHSDKEWAAYIHIHKQE